MPMGVYTHTHTHKYTHILVRKGKIKFLALGYRPLPEL